MGNEAHRTLREARAVYFGENDIAPDGGYDDRWVIIKVGSFPVFAFPHTEGRKRDVPLHDLHHVLTGYDTTILGEAETGPGS